MANDISSGATDSPIPPKKSHAGRIEKSLPYEKLPYSAFENAVITATRAFVDFEIDLGFDEKTGSSYSTTIRGILSKLPKSDITTLDIRNYVSQPAALKCAFDGRSSRVSEHHESNSLRTLLLMIADEFEGEEKETVKNILSRAIEPLERAINEAAQKAFSEEVNKRKGHSAA